MTFIHTQRLRKGTHLEVIFVTWQSSSLLGTHPFWMIMTMDKLLMLIICMCAFLIRRKIDEIELTH